MGPSGSEESPPPGEYTVSVKPSARRINSRAAMWVAENGPQRRFESKAAARAWADAIGNGRCAVRVQNAAPNDPAPVDGYVVADPARRRQDSGGRARSASTLDEFDDR